MFRKLFIITTSLVAAWTAHADDGLELPDGFNASVFHEGPGRGRHIAIRENGDVYMASRPPFGPPGAAEKLYIIAMRDTDGDGKADITESFSEIEGTGMRFYKGMLYVSDYTTVYRFRFNGNELVPSSAPEVIVSGFGEERQHADKPITFDDQGHIYVNVGAPSNACQTQPRTPGSPGLEPCPLLEKFGGIWRFDAEKAGQTQARDGIRFASGLRNSIALTWNKQHAALYVVQHGRDQLDTLWPDFYNARDNALRTAEEMVMVREPGTVFGWPYTYYDALLDQRMLAPEYGGNGKLPAPEGKYPDPLVAFPAHWGPNDILFYDGNMFPEKYRGGAFIAFHGSWNRAPLPQAGYNVVFVPANDTHVTGHYQVFIDGFAGEPESGAGAFNFARYRPVGLAVAPDGALFVSDSMRGRIWRVSFNPELKSE